MNRWTKLEEQLDEIEKNTDRYLVAAKEAGIILRPVPRKHIREILEIIHINKNIIFIMDGPISIIHNVVYEAKARKFTDVDHIKRYFRNFFNITFGIYMMYQTFGFLQGSESIRVRFANMMYFDPAFGEFIKEEEMRI